MSGPAREIQGAPGPGAGADGAPARRRRHLGAGPHPRNARRTELLRRYPDTERGRRQAHLDEERDERTRNQQHRRHEQQRDRRGETGVEKGIREQRHDYQRDDERGDRAHRDRRIDVEGAACEYFDLIVQMLGAPNTSLQAVLERSRAVDRPREPVRQDHESCRYTGQEEDRRQGRLDEVRDVEMSNVHTMRECGARCPYDASSMKELTTLEDGEPLLESCHRRSIELLTRNLSPGGILAATPGPRAHKRGYTSIFGRDAAVCAIGMALSGDETLLR